MVLRGLFNQCVKLSSLVEYTDLVAKQRVKQQAHGIRHRKQNDIENPRKIDGVRPRPKGVTTLKYTHGVVCMRTRVRVYTCTCECVCMCARIITNVNLNIPSSILINRRRTAETWSKSECRVSARRCSVCSSAALPERVVLCGHAHHRPHHLPQIDCGMISPKTTIEAVEATIATTPLVSCSRRMASVLFVATLPTSKQHSK